MKYPITEEMVDPVITRFAQIIVARPGRPRVYSGKTIAEIEANHPKVLERLREDVGDILTALAETYDLLYKGSWFPKKEEQRIVVEDLVRDAPRMVVEVRPLRLEERRREVDMERIVKGGLP